MGKQLFPVYEYRLAGFSDTAEGADQLALELTRAMPEGSAIDSYVVGDPIDDSEYVLTT